LEVDLAVAKTVRPCLAKLLTRAWPMPPLLQPVIRTDFGIFE
jgi:hypothetical protein